MFKVTLLENFSKEVGIKYFNTREEANTYRSKEISKNSNLTARLTQEKNYVPSTDKECESGSCPIRVKEEPITQEQVDLLNNSLPDSLEAAIAQPLHPLEQEGLTATESALEPVNKGPDEKPATKKRGRPKKKQD